jgi:hypothetical protein
MAGELMGCRYEKRMSQVKTGRETACMSDMKYDCVLCSLGTRRVSTQINQKIASNILNVES